MADFKIITKGYISSGKFFKDYTTFLIKDNDKSPVEVKIYKQCPTYNDIYMLLKVEAEGDKFYWKIVDGVKFEPENFNELKIQAYKMEEKDKDEDFKNEVVNLLNKILVEVEKQNKEKLTDNEKKAIYQYIINNNINIDNSTKIEIKDSTILIDNQIVTDVVLRPKKPQRVWSWEEFKAKAKSGDANDAANVEAKEYFMTNWNSRPSNRKILSEMVLYFKDDAKAATLLSTYIKTIKLKESLEESIETELSSYWLDKLLSTYSK